MYSRKYSSDERVIWMLTNMAICVAYALVGLRDVACDIQRMKEAIIRILATCLTAFFQTPPFDLTLLLPPSVLLGLLWKMLIKVFRALCRQRDKKVSLAKTLKFSVIHTYTCCSSVPHYESERSPSFISVSTSFKAPQWRASCAYPIGSKASHQ